MSQPGFFFYTGDWLKDTRILSPQARGCWADALCFLNEHGGEVEWSVSAYARFWGVSEAEAVTVLEEILDTHTGNVEMRLPWQNDGKAIAKLSSRRILREVRKRAETKEKRADAGRKGAAVRWESIAKNAPLPSPSLLPSLLISKEEDKNKRRTRTCTPWPPEDIWLKKLIEQQPFFSHAVEQLADFAWWEDVAKAINGIEPALIEPEFAKISAWLRENPGRKPTAKGMRRFVRTWLERARENQRRLYAVKK